MHEYIKFDSVSFIEIDTNEGNSQYKCVNRVIEMNFNTNGILMMNENVMLKYWSLNTDLDFDRIWFTKQLTCWQESKNVGNSSFRDEDLFRKVWNGRWGIKQLLEVWNDFDRILSGTLKEDDLQRISIVRYFDTLKSNYKSGKYSKSCMSKSDLFYIPKKYLIYFYYVTKVFEKHNVVGDLVVGTVLSGLAPLNQTKILKGSFESECNNCLPLYSNSVNFRESYSKITHFYHPLLLLDTTSGLGNLNICKSYINEKYQND